MAGQKETPRQKMIGMMYLVLTALLALQVSNAVLEKFAIIVGTIDIANKEIDAKNKILLAEVIKSAGTSTEENKVTAKKNAEIIRQKTADAIDKIEALKKEMIAKSGTDKVDGKMINDHSMKVATMMIAPKENTGKDFEKLLKDYVKDLRSLSGLTAEQLPEIAKAPKDMPMFKDDPDHAEKSFLVFNFENTPPIAALATVNQLESEVMQAENKALAALKAKAGAEDLTFDQVVPMVRPEASIVAAGAKYKADMFITASNSSYQPEFYRNGTKLEVISDPVTSVKMGKVEFTASANSYDKDGLSKQTFKAEIHLNDKKYEQDITYFVAQPVIRVTTGNAPTLYMNCGNNVNIEVPTLGTNYNPDFRATGAEIRKGDKPGKVTIIPTQRKVTVAVNNGGVFIGNQPFDVKPIPKPDFEIKAGSQTVNMKDGVRGSALTSLRVAAVPEANFKQEVPQDAVYRIRSMEVIHARGTAPVNRMTATNESIELGAWRAQLRPGDNIVIEVKTVTRRTFLGGDERVDVGTEIFRIPVN